MFPQPPYTPRLDFACVFTQFLRLQLFFFFPHGVSLLFLVPLFWADLLLFIRYYLFSFINSSSGSGGEVFVPSTNPSKTSTRCQQLQCDPKSLNPDHPSHGEERVKGNFCNKSSSLHLSFISVSIPVPSQAPPVGQVLGPTLVREWL